MRALHSNVRIQYTLGSSDAIQKASHTLNLGKYIYTKGYLSYMKETITEKSNESEKKFFLERLNNVVRYAV